MYKYFPHNEQDIKEMLKRIGVEKIEDLFTDIPQNILTKKELPIDKGLSEIELRQKINALANKNKQFISFLGAGAYEVYTPSIISALLSRQEFLTSYTPYQPEISQGTLQYIFEFQSMICELTNMDVANASLYDGATATAEAVFMATSQTRRNKVLVSKTINPRILDVIKTYAKYRDIEIIVVDMVDFCLDKEDLRTKLTDDVAALVVQYPNYYGVVEDFQEVVDLVHTNKSLFIMNADPSTLSVLKTPGEIGCDIVCGEAQTLGIPLNFGGPYLGYMATTSKLLRKLPGRIVGMTNDVDGKRGYVLTIQAREQHIRREKATSNICSNQSLMALNAVIYGSLLGKKGLVDVAKRAYNNAHYLYKKLLQTKKFTAVTTKPFFKEFVVKSFIDIDKLNQYLETKGFLGGLNLGDGQYLLCATEVRTKEEIDKFVSIVEEAACTIN
ncbi:MAG TPA: aminomethyl-transferring glycine dehydrogenase subunit GcvPA [Bacilli bacterium]|nr:aminomethyl-transferring glycine dehydrogenase subunit GcvPA [Acholeplasmataceae bacterium]HNZ77488.1 aminomethyl-transferring glycine dehydrogenase subunit GcvPA [Bacilli bacterium]HOH61359.1 aminomethyl-transferring glycine dehydrogenase subunit GcvPA [Bacilli bacterium]HPB49447.1 aminomethyl-transferring glycine dehydrogenase subunit GcvPA [Bacilli bacterium]HPM14966.1 aminomethyl-transferring glycine dehydrogenase subunit GcvPA [Bacilli bacterium]